MVRDGESWWTAQKDYNVFLGEYQAQFTGRGRIVLPKKFRQELGGKKAILSRGFEGCIWGFTKTGFEKEAARQLEVSATDNQAREVRRYLFSAAEQVLLDEQGRFVIPKPLLEYAKLRGGVVIIGAGDHFEIWDPLTWRMLIAGLTKKR